MNKTQPLFGIRAIAEAAGIDGREALTLVRSGYGTELALLARSRQADRGTYGKLTDGHSQDARALNRLSATPVKRPTLDRSALSFW